MLRTFSGLMRTVALGPWVRWYAVFKARRTVYWKLARTSGNLSSRVWTSSATSAADHSCTLWVSLGHFFCPTKAWNISWAPVLTSLKHCWGISDRKIPPCWRRW